MKVSPVQIWSDGGCWPNPGPGGWAAVILQGDSRCEIKGRSAYTTNNRMELIAAIEALCVLLIPSEVDLYTDSQYLQMGATKWIAGWKRANWTRRIKGRGIPMSSGKRMEIPNTDLWKEIDRLKGIHKIKWHWVKGHSDCEENNRADFLAEIART